MVKYTWQPLPDPITPKTKWKGEPLPDAMETTTPTPPKEAVKPTSSESVYSNNTSGSDTIEIPKPTILNTWEYRDTAKENADFIDKKVSWGKTVTNTVTSNWKTTKTYSDGTTETTDSGISETTGTPNRNNILDETKNIYSEQEKLDADIRSRYEKLQVQGDDAYNSQVKYIGELFSATRKKLTDSNARFEAKTSQGQYLNNGFRYTPQSSEGMVYDAEQAGIARLGDLNLQEAQALQLALKAKQDQDYKALGEYTTAVRNIQKDRIDTLTEMTKQIKTIEDTDKSIRNMNQNEAKVMQSMIDSYILTAGEMDAKETEAYYTKKAGELSELMGFKVAPQFVKAQVEWANANAKLEVNEWLTKVNGFYTDSLGRALTDPEGKKIPFEKEDWGKWVEGNMLNVGTYDENGNKVIKTYELKWGEKSYAQILKDMPPTQTNISAQALSQAYKWEMSDILTQPDGVRLPTTVAAFKNLQWGGMQCAEYVNRIMGTSFGSSMQDKLNKANEKTGQVGSAIVWDAGDKTYGHIGIILADNGDSWTVRSSNIRGDTKISTDTIPKSVAKGYFTPDAVKNMPMEVTGKYDPVQDKNLTQIGNSKDGGIFQDKNTGQTITGQEAEALYGQKTPPQGTGIGQDPNLRSIAIGNIAFWKNMSNTERLAVLDIIKTYPNASNQEISLLVKNMYLDNPKNTEKAIQYLDVFKNMKTPPLGYEAQIANLINRWDFVGLDTFVEANIERAVKEDVPADEFISRSSYNSLKQNVQTLQWLIDRNKDKIGAFDGRVADLLKKFKADPEYQEIKTLLSMSVADVRRKFAGSAVTETEMRALEDFIWGKTTWQESNLQTYLKSMLDKTTRAYENQRALYRKPEVNSTFSQPSTPTQNDTADFSSLDA